MDVWQAIETRRSVRKFQQIPVEMEKLRRIVDAGRLAPNGANQQPLKFRIVREPELVKQICRCVNWAIRITPQGIPAETEEPTAFIAVLADTSIKPQGHQAEAGAAVENMLLAACAQGLGGCWMGAIDRARIMQIMQLGEPFALLFVIALGYPAETPVTEPLVSSPDYYKDSQGVLHVPKRSLKDVLV